MVGGIKPTDVLTHEQIGVVNHSIRDGEVLKVVALAGKQWLLHYFIVSATKICSEVVNILIQVLGRLLLSSNFLRHF